MEEGAGEVGSGDRKRKCKKPDLQLREQRATCSPRGGRQKSPKPLTAHLGADPALLCTLDSSAQAPPARPNVLKDYIEPLGH